jgi:CO/xanthine dehydrogenase Mo-binding subunit
MEKSVGDKTPAIASSALFNATGKWVIDFPITPDKVY